MPESILKNSGPMPMHQLQKEMKLKYGRSQVKPRLSTAMQAGAIVIIDGHYQLATQMEENG